MKFCCKCKVYVSENDSRKLRRCKHIYCCQCLVEMVKDLGVLKVKCSINNCKENIHDQLMREILSNDQLKSYEEIQIKGSENVFKCLTLDCPGIYIFENEDIIFQCSYCKSPNCIKCKQRHFPNQCVKNEKSEEIIYQATKFIKERKREELQELQKHYILLPNPESFTCPICFNFILPRVGVILRNCHHLFCEDCLKITFNDPKYLKNFTCPQEKCMKPLDPGEISFFINDKDLCQMMLKEASSRIYSCKNGNCEGLWDIKERKGSYECPICHEMNCLECQDIHDESCALFRRSKRYKSIVDQEKILKSNESISCYHCCKILIRRGGCGSLRCDLCGNHTCVYTGKIAGQHKPEKCYCSGGDNCIHINKYCGCSTKKKCDDKCIYACLPEEEDD